MIICYWNGTSKLNSPGVLDLLTPKVDSYPSDFLSSVTSRSSSPMTMSSWFSFSTWDRSIVKLGGAMTSNKQCESWFNNPWKSNNGILQWMEGEFLVCWWCPNILVIGLPKAWVAPKRQVTQDLKKSLDGTFEWGKETNPSCSFWRAFFFSSSAAWSCIWASTRMFTCRNSALWERGLLPGQQPLDADLGSIIQTLGQDSGLGMVSVGANG